MVQTGATQAMCHYPSELQYYTFFAGGGEGLPIVLYLANYKTHFLPLGTPIDGQLFSEEVCEWKICQNA